MSDPITEIDKPDGLIPVTLETVTALVAEVRRLRGEAGPFICGTVGQCDTGGLHDGYVICPQFGSDYVAVFMRKRADK